MTEVPLVVYGQDGNRKVIGTARVNMETDEIHAEVTDEAWAQLIKNPNEGVSPWSYSTFVRKNSEGVFEPLECAAVPMPALPFKGRIKLPESFKTPPTIEDHIILGED